MERPRDDFEPTEKAKTPRLDGSRILVVDDTEDIRTLLARVIERAGAKVRTASSAEEALAAIGEAPPDLILTDIGMPDADGFELLDRVRRLPREEVRDIRAIALTGFTSHGYRERCLAAGFEDHLAKPIDLEDLIVSIARALGRGPARPRANDFPRHACGFDAQARAV